jgi:hypothetical protein
MFSSWNMVSPAPKTTLAASTTLDDFLLRTPVLKARAPATSVIKRSTVLEPLESAGGPTKITDDWKGTTRNTTRTKENLPALNASAVRDNSIGGNMDKKNSFRRTEKIRENKKRMEDEREGSDEEHVNRLSSFFVKMMMCRPTFHLKASRNAENERD